MSSVPARLGLGLLLAAGGILVAQQGGTEDRAVAIVGSEKISANELEKRLRKAPPHQLKMYGKTAADVRERFVGDLIDFELMVQAARADGVDQNPEVRDLTTGVLKSALLNDIRRGLDEKGAITAAEVKAYYDAHKDRYQSQTRIQLWQIVVGSREEARSLIDTIKSDPEYKKDPVAKWGELARERSLDKSTAMRNGNLGFVRPDGATSHKEVRVSTALYNAALELEDGQVAEKPIKADRFWVVLQRRGAIDTPARSLKEVTPSIRAALVKRKMTQQVDELLTKLRNEYVQDVHPDRVDQIKISADGQLEAVGRPGALPRRSHPAKGSPRPQGAPGKMR